jgi:hypothetical protein
MVHSVKKVMLHAFIHAHIHQHVQQLESIPGELHLSKNLKPFLSIFVSKIIPPSTTKAV